jgi:hypothetical protein
VVTSSYPGRHLIPHNMTPVLVEGLTRECLREDVSYHFDMSVEMGSASRTPSNTRQSRWAVDDRKYGNTAAFQNNTSLVSSRQRALHRKLPCTPIHAAFYVTIRRTRVIRQLAQILWCNLVHACIPAHQCLLH